MDDKHRFKIGETVRVSQSANPNISRNSYKVVRLLPAEGRDFQYRLKSVIDGQERVVRESDLG